MSNLIRRLVRNDRGQLVEVELVEAPDTDAKPEPVMEADGRITPRYRRFVADVAPPPPSGAYRQDANYARVGIIPATRQQAIANHRRWQERHGQAAGRIIGWLAAEGLLGDETRKAYTANQRAGQTKAQARRAVADAKTAANQAAEALYEAVVAHLESSNGALPTGGEAIAARAAVDGFELVAAHVDEAGDQAAQRWGRCLDRADWVEALRQAGQLKGSEAETAATWLRAKLRPPPGPTVDPLAWI